MTMPHVTVIAVLLSPGVAARSWTKHSAAGLPGSTDRRAADTHKWMICVRPHASPTQF
jgi:hypothetical protein